MKQDLVHFLYSVHESSDLYPVESCAEMLHGFRILDANDLDEIMKNATMVDRKFALVRALSTKDDVMILVWAKILDEMGIAGLGNKARQKYNEVVEHEPVRRTIHYNNNRREPSTDHIDTSRTDDTSRLGRTSLTTSEHISTVPESPVARRRAPSKQARDWRLGDIPNHLGVYLDRDEEWDIRSAILQLFQPGATLQRPPPNKRPNRAPRQPPVQTSPAKPPLLPFLHQSQQVSVLLNNGTEGAAVDLTRPPKFHTEKGAQRPLLLAITGQRGIGKSTMVAHILSDDVFLQRQCGVGTVLWLNAAAIHDEDTFFEEIASRIDFRHPKDSRLKLRDILPSVLANLKQAVLLVVDDASVDNLAWFSLLGGKSLRCVFIFKGEKDDHVLTEQLGPQLARDSIIVEHVGRVGYEDMLWLVKSHWKSDLSMPPGLTPESLLQIAETLHGLPIMTSLTLSLLENSTSPEQTSKVLECLSHHNRDPYIAIGSLVDLALSRESQDFKDRFYWMLAFGQGQPISVEDLSLVWNSPRARTKLFCVDLADKGLIVSTSSKPGLINKLQDNCSYVVQKAIFDALEANLQMGHESIAKFVANQLTSPNFKNPKLAQARPGENFFHLAARIGNIRLLKCLVDLVCSNREVGKAVETLCREQDRFQQQTPLHFLFDRASQESWDLLSQICERLVSTNVSTQGRDKKGRSLCELAVVELNDRRVGSGQTLLMLAARQLCYRFAKQLIQTASTFQNGDLLKEFLNAKDDYGRSCLHQQSTEEGGSVDMVKLLLDSGADLEAVDNKRRTALHYVARFGCIDVCVVLIDRKCVLAPLDDCGKTPLMLARVARHYGIIKLLEGYERELETEKREGPRRPAVETPIEERVHSAGVGDQDIFMHDVGMQTLPTATLPSFEDDSMARKKDEDAASLYDEYSESSSYEDIETIADTESLASGKPGTRNKNNISKNSRKGRDKARTVGGSRRGSTQQQSPEKLMMAGPSRNATKTSIRTNLTIVEADESPKRRRQIAGRQRRGHSEDDSDDEATARSTARKLPQIVPKKQPISDGSTNLSPRRNNKENSNHLLAISNQMTAETASLRSNRGGEKVDSEKASKAGSPRRLSKTESELERERERREKAKTQESIRLHKASKIKICARRGDIPEQIVYFERREEEDKLRDALLAMCQSPRTLIAVVTGDRGCGARTLVGEVLQQDDFIRDTCFVDMVLWVKLFRYGGENGLEFDEESFYRAFSRLLQIREPSANPVTTKEQKISILERKLRENLADRLRPMILVVEGATLKEHAEVATSVLKLSCPLLKLVLISRQTLLNLNPKHHDKDDDYAILSSFGDQVGSVHTAIKVRSLAKGKLGTMFQGFWSKPTASANPLDAILAKAGGANKIPLSSSSMLELPTIEDLAEIYVGRPSLVANILYVALKSCYYEQDIQESFYGFVEALKNRQALQNTQDQTMPPKMSQTEASVHQVLKFILDKEPKDFKRRYYSFMLFDDSDVIGQVNQQPLSTISENASVNTKPVTSVSDEVAVAIVWNPYKNRYDNDLLLRALRRFGLTRHVGKFNYEVCLLIMPHSLVAQLNKPDFSMPMKPLRFLQSLVAFRSWFLANSLAPSDQDQLPPPAPPTTTHRTSRTADYMDGSDSARYGLHSTMGDTVTSASNPWAKSRWNKSKKRVVVCNLKPKRVSANGRLTNRTVATADGDAPSSNAKKVLSPYAVKPQINRSRKPVPNLVIEGGKERLTNPVVAVLYYFDKVMHSY